MRIEIVCLSRQEVEVKEIIQKKEIKVYCGKKEIASSLDIWIRRVKLGISVPKEKM